MDKKHADTITVIRKGRDLILKFNPYHGYHGYFSTRNDHVSFSPGQGKTRERSIMMENKRRMESGDTELVAGEYMIVISGGKIPYEAAREGMLLLQQRKEELGENNIIKNMPLFGTQYHLETQGVEFKEVHPLKKTISEEEIVKKIGGLDNTDGSCASLSLAYAANKNGLDVTDFRGGESQDIMSQPDWSIARIANLDGVRSHSVAENNDFIAMRKHIDTMELDKEYILSIGRHCSVVRKTEHGLKYLELQDKPEHNGWHEWKPDTGDRRFGMSLYHDHKATSYLIDIDSLKGNNDVRALMGYINTDKNNQQIGDKGNVR